MWSRIATANRASVATVAIILSVVLFLCINLVTSLWLGNARVDLTEDKLYTVSQTTRDVLTSVSEPITLKLYLSSSLLDADPTYRVYANRVEQLMDSYESISGGLVHAVVIDPVPFSDAEEDAIGQGLTSATISRAGDQAYFGMVATNSVDQIEVIAAMDPNREQYLEYDLTRMVSRLESPTEPKVGLLDGLGIYGSQALGRQPSAMINRLAEDYSVEQVQSDSTIIPDDIDVLMVVHPHDLSPSTLYAIDQYVIRGKPAIVFMDVVAQHSTPDPTNSALPQFPTSNLDPVLAAWGIQIPPDKVVGDQDMALQVRAQAGQQVAVVKYLPWLIVDHDNFNPDDIITGSLNLMRISTAGTILPTDNATTSITPLIFTTTQSELLDKTTILQRSSPQELLNAFVSSNTRQILAARVTGPVTTAFPGGAPPKPAPPTEDADPYPDPPPLIAASEGPVNLIIVSDTDLLTDDHNVDASTGSLITNNEDFVVNSIDSLNGGVQLIGLRGRGIAYRPFVRVNEIEATAEAKYRDSEQQLQTELTDTQNQLDQLQQQAETTGQVGTATRQQQEAIANYNQRRVELGQQLRDVQAELRADIDSLSNKLRLINILAIPILVILLGIFVAVWRRVRLSRYLRARRATA